jgi:hypothetical protein
MVRLSGLGIRRDIAQAVRLRSKPLADQLLDDQQLWMTAFVGSAADRYLSLPFRLGASFNRLFDRSITHTIAGAFQEILLDVQHTCRWRGWIYRGTHEP